MGFFLAWWGECDLTRGLVGKSLKALVNTAVIWGGGVQGGRGRKETEEGKKEVSVNGIAGMYRGGWVGYGIVQTTGILGCESATGHTHKRTWFSPWRINGFKWFVACSVLRCKLPNKQGITSKIQLKKQHEITNTEPEERRLKFWPRKWFTLLSVEFMVSYQIVKFQSAYISCSLNLNYWMENNSYKNT